MDNNFFSSYLGFSPHKKEENSEIIESDQKISITAIGNVTVLLEVEKKY